jgi:hypothetical protein
MTGWLAAFLFTELIEVPIYVARLRCSILRGFGASALTHPIIWFGFFHPRLPGGYYQHVVAAELFAWLAEAAYFGRFGWRRAILTSLLANGASLTIGLTARRLFGWP